MDQFYQEQIKCILCISAPPPSVPVPISAGIANVLEQTTSITGYNWQTLFPSIRFIFANVRTIMRHHTTRSICCALYISIRESQSPKDKIKEAEKFFGKGGRGIIVIVIRDKQPSNKTKTLCFCFRLLFDCCLLFFLILFCFRAILFVCLLWRSRRVGVIS